MSERDIFLAALEIADPAARAAYLAEACGADAGLRRRVDGLLAVAGSESFMAPLAAGLGRPESTGAYDPDRTTGVGSSGPPAEPAGTLLADRYVLGELIGEGGMGAVYRADQVRPVKRPVAVKLVKPGMDSRAVLARFEAERQALAVMDHPGIAKVLDAGATPDGRPFFVMELVNGVPLTDYCDGKRLPVGDRLELFRQVCGAVQHAHQKGVIHRDLKPSNILVEEVDGRPVPKVIDFGIAKATGDAPLADGTLFTAAGAVMGTPLYMAPEQAGGAPDVDTRADVYALGAVLYELLTGSTPIRRDTLKEAAVQELLRVIREDDPPAPSSRLSGSDTLPSVAANRGTEPARLGRFVRGDLDWVVMKALEKDRGRRYESAAALAADVDRFLHHEPVAAGPPSRWYRVRKFVRRNRAAVTAAGLVLLALVLGAAGATAGLVEARRQRDAADAARQAEADRAEGERRAKEDAQANLGYAVQGNAILGAVFAGLDPKQIAESGRPLQDVLRENLRAAAAALDGAAIGDPLVVAGMRHTLGVSLLGLGDYEAAAGLLEKARAARLDLRGPDDPDALRTATALAHAHQDAGRIDQALPLLDEVYRRRRDRLGPDDPDTLAALGNLAEGLVDAGDLGRAVPLMEEVHRRTAARLGPDSPDALRAMSNLAMGHLAAGRPDRAVPLMEEALGGMRARLPPDHPDALRAVNNLAAAYEEAGRPDRAVRLWEESVRVRRAKLGPDHPDTLRALASEAKGRLAAGDVGRAVALHEEVVPLLERRHGRRHPDTLRAIGHLATAYRAAGRADDALPLLEEAYRGRDLAPAPGVTRMLLDHYFGAGRVGEAAGLVPELVADARRALPAGSPSLAGVLAECGLVLLQAGAFADAEGILRECLAIRERALPDDWRTSNTRSQLGGALLGRGRPTEAEPLLVAGYEGLAARRAAVPPSGRGRLPEAADRLVEVYERLGKPDEAKRWRAERAQYPFIAPPPRPAK